MRSPRWVMGSHQKTCLHSWLSDFHRGTKDRLRLVPLAVPPQTELLWPYLTSETPFYRCVVTMGLLTKQVTPIAKPWQTRTRAYRAPSLPALWAEARVARHSAAPKRLPPTTTPALGRYLVTYLAEVTGLAGQCAISLWPSSYLE